LNQLKDRLRKHSPQTLFKEGLQMGLSEGWQSFRCQVLERHLSCRLIGHRDSGLIGQLGIEAELEVSDFEDRVHD
jgi:hypothetical protein